MRHSVSREPASNRNTRLALKHPTSLQGGIAMAKATTDFARQSTEQAVQATDWMRAIAEQNLNQSKAAFEGFLTIPGAPLVALISKRLLCATPCCLLKKRSKIHSTSLASWFV